MPFGFGRDYGKAKADPYGMTTKEQATTKRTGNYNCVRALRFDNNTIGKGGFDEWTVKF